MGAKWSRGGIATALAGFVGGYLTALVRMRSGEQRRERRTRILVSSLHRLVKKYAAAGVFDDEAAG